MPFTTRINDRGDLTLVGIFNQEASRTLLDAFDAGRCVEQVASTVSDPGDDYTAFTVDGREVVRIPGY